MESVGPTQVFFVPSVQVPTFDMPQYRKRLDQYVELPNVKDNIFVGKFTPKGLVKDLESYKSNDRYYIGGTFVIETIQGDINDLVYKSSKRLRRESSVRKKLEKKTAKYLRQKSRGNWAKIST